MLKLLKQTLRNIHSLENLLLVALVTSMLVIAVFQIILRNFADSGLVWADPLLRIFVLWLALIGGMVATRDGGHININIAGHYLKGGPKLIATFISQLLSGAVCLLLAWHSWQFVMLEKEDGMIAFLDYPAWWFEIAIPIAFAVMGFRFVVCSLIYIISKGHCDSIDSALNDRASHGSSLTESTSSKPSSNQSSGAKQSVNTK